jgi:2-oxo-4-hydroxy-4-carboxy-5-ureidoimidazoline decarboxylase
LEQYLIYKNLAWLNELDRADARERFLACCRSQFWAERMTDARPFPLVETMFQTADRLWSSLSPSDWLEAFAHEDVETYDTPELTQLKRAYLERFGFNFIVCPVDRNVDEIVAIAGARLRNSGQTELRLAVEEQRRNITIRLTDLLER